MASARQDFERFVRWLYQPERNVPVDVRRLANLSLTHFDALAETSRQRSQRSTFLVGLIRQQLSTTGDLPPPIAAEPANIQWPWVRLRNFTLGPFRGFREPEPFDLRKQIILLYGPNGSGKTSFCEALEYSLLGDVEEAGAKRINARTYLMNDHARRFDPPVLTASDHRGREVPVNADPDTYRFFFIEKNRIDAFSRIAARPSAQRAELIATLFGMDQFNEFVSHFNDSIDGQLTLLGTKEAELTARRQRLAVDEETVEGGAAAFQKLSDEEAALAQEYAQGTTYEELKRLIGNEDAPGRLQELEQILEAVPPPLVGVTRQSLHGAFGNVHVLDGELNRITDALRVRSDQVSFKRLYESVLELQETVGTHCPACETPLAGPTSVAVNPYDKATAGLRELEELGTLQERQKATQAEAAQGARELKKVLELLTSFAVAQNGQDAPIVQYLQRLSAEPGERWWVNIFPEPPADGPDASLLEQLLAVADQISTHDAQSQRAHQERQLHVAERNRLIEFRLKVLAQDIKRQQLRERIAAAHTRIKAFGETNATLIEQTDQERREIERDLPFKVTYDRFLDELRAYRDQLPRQMMAGLNEVAMTLYNSFNRSDRNEDKLAVLQLPLTNTGKIEIAFRGNPERLVDALHVLSEGHIRCLGLAILLAKAKSISCPVIIFDDAINAIDHDHRGGIRETIFENDDFAQTQLIVTCHSNEFIKDIQQHLPPQRRNDCQVYLFRHHDGDYQPKVRNNISSANYVAKARKAREELNDRDALASSRRALEMLCEKVWWWLASHGQGVLNLQLATVGAEPQLRNLSDAIASKLRGAATFNHPNKDLLLAAYDRILGIPIDNLVWVYLNKGTHEEADRDDFDGDVVESVVQTLEELDRLDLRRGR